MSRTLLYIDSDPVVRRLLKKALVPAGYTVMEADSPAAGREVAAQAPPDVVLVDVDAVGTEAAEITRTLRKWPETARAVLLAATAEDRPEYLRMTTNCGFDGVVVKPLDLDALAERLAAEAQPALAPAESSPALDLAGIPAPWRRTLAVLTGEAVRRLSVASARLALVAKEEDALVLVAAHSVRAGGDGPTIGVRIPLGGVAWLRPVLEAREVLVLDPEPIGPSPLLARGSVRVLLLPVASEEKLHGVLILGERLRRAFIFPPAQVAECVREASRIAGVLTTFERMEVALGDARREIEQFRLQATRRVTTGDGGQGAAPDGNRPALARRLAARLELSPTECDVLAQALEVHDVGRTWVRSALIAHIDLSREGREAVLAVHAEQTLQILTALGWSPAVLDLVKTHQGLSRGGFGTTPSGRDIPLAARILAVVTAYDGLVGASERLGGTLSPDDALRELARDTTGYDLEVVATLAALLAESNGARR